MRLVKVGFLVFMLIMSCAALTSAQALTGKFAFTPQIGLSIPVGDFADTDTTNAKRGGATTGFAFAGSGEYYFSENLAIGGKFGYNRFGLDEDTYADMLMGGTVDGHIKIMELGAYLKYIFTSASPTKFYGRAGAMFGKLKLDGDYTIMDQTFSGEADIAWSFGMEGGVGVMHMAKENIAIFGELMYTTLMTDGKDMDVTDPISGETVTDEAEGNADYLGFKAGAVFFFGGE